MVKNPIAPGEPHGRLLTRAAADWLALRLRPVPLPGSRPRSWPARRPGYSPWQAAPVPMLLRLLRLLRLPARRPPPGSSSCISGCSSCSSRSGAIATRGTIAAPGHLCREGPFLTPPPLSGKPGPLLLELGLLGGQVSRCAGEGFVDGVHEAGPEVLLEGGEVILVLLSGVHALGIEVEHIAALDVEVLRLACLGDLEQLWRG